MLPVAILFRYSLNQFTPAKVMVEALTIENYVRFFTDPYYRTILYRPCAWRWCALRSASLLAFPLAYVPGAHADRASRIC